MRSFFQTTKIRTSPFPWRESVIVCLIALFEITHANAANPSPQYFISSNQPPAGFENIDPNAPQTTMVSVYYGDQLLVNTLATFNNQTITFSNPTQILNNLQGLKNSNLLNSELAKTQDSHSNLLCQDGSGNYCKALNPKTIGVIFDPNSYKAYLFLNPNNIQVTPIQNNLPDSTAGFSALLNNDALLTHNQFNTYALNTQGMLGEGNGYLSSTAYYTHADNSNAQDSLDMTEAAGHFYKNQNLYSAGVLQSSGTGLLNQSVSIIGAEIQNQYQPPGLAFSGQGSPVVIYLSMPSQVQVYRGNNLIYAQNLSAGKHQLDTSGFPTGSYDIDIKITNTLQQVQELHQIFIKSSGNLDLNSTKYSFSLGAIEKTDPSLHSTNSSNNLNISNTQLPQASDQAVLGIDRSQMLGDFIQWDEHLISNIPNGYLDSELTYFGNNYQVNPGLLISNHQEYGLGGSANYQYKNIYFALNTLRLWGTAGKLNQDQIDNQNSNFNTRANNLFMPLSSTKYYLSANTNFSWKDDQYSFLSQWQEDVFNNYSQTSSISYTHPLFKSKSTSTYLTASASHSTYDSQINIGIQFNFSTQYFDGQAIMGYQDQRVPANSSNNNQAQTNQGTTEQVSLNKFILFSQDHYLNWNLTGRRDPNSTNSSADIDYVSTPFRAHGDYLHSAINANSNQASYQYDLYSLELDSSLAYSSGKLGIGYPNNKQAGVLIDIHAPDFSSTEILIDGQPIAIVSNNIPTPIFLAPYKTYNLTINPLGSGMQYGYDTQPKTVTLYTGNLQDLEWTLEKHRILFAKIVNSKHQPLDKLLLDIKNKYDVTDSTGYLQTEIPASLKTLKFVSEDGERCEIQLPQNLTIDNGLTVLDQPLVCDLK